MGILSGVMSYIFGLVLNVLDAAIDGFLEALGFDLNSFEQYFPAAADYHEVIIGFALGLLFIMFVFQIFRNFGVVLDMEAEDPLKTLGKTALFFGMIISSRSITNTVIQLLVDPYNIFINAPSAAYEFKLRTIVTGMFNSAFANPFMSIVVLIMMLVLGWQFLKLLIEVVERYIVFYFVIYTAPVVFATGPFKSTAPIFKSWCRMVGSQAMLLLLNVWSIKLFLSFLPVFEQGGSDIGSIFFNFLIGYAFLSFAQKADTLLRILGLPTASTGDIVHSLGGTVAGIAHAIRGIGGGIGKGVSALGGLFGKGAEAATSAVGAGASTAANAGSSAVSSMAGVGGAAANAAGGALGNGFQSGGGGSRGGGADSRGTGGSEESQNATASGISSAKQSFTNEVLGSAQDQLGAQNNAQQQGMGESMADQSGEGAPEDHIRMDSSEASIGNPQEINSETMEGLANLAHGIPHDNYDPDTGRFSGGGFSEFTGRDANTIGSSQLTPADGVEQYHVDMGNGEVGTVYKNSETGDAHVVKFDSVDNGVMQGSISQIDPQTGQVGASMPFQAVHDSVPGASSVNPDSVPVADSEGGVYHLSTEAPTSFFAPGQSGTMQGGGAAATPDAVDPGVSVPGPSVDGNRVDGGGTTRGGGGGRDSYGNSSSPPAESPPVDPGMPPPASIGGNFDPGGGRTRGGGAGRGTFSRSRTAPSAESPSIDAGMSSTGPQNEVSRFGRDNPDNVEVFKRDNSNVQSYNKYTPDTVPLNLDD